MRHRASLVRSVSAILVLAGLLLIPPALYLAYAGRLVEHATLMAGVLLPVFVAGVAVSYVTSALAPRRATAAAARLAALALAGGLLALAAGGQLLARGTASLQLLALAYALTATGLLQSLAALRGAPFSLLASVGGLALAYVLATLYTAYTIAAGTDPFHAMLGLAYAIPVTSIYAVTIHSLPRTYQREPRRLLVAALYTVQAVGLAAYAFKPRAGVALLALGFALYPLAARFDLLPEGLRRAGRLRGAARGSHLYYVWGHTTAAILSAAAIAATAYHLASPDFNSFTLLIHTVTLGFTACHIALHAPLMLPVILGVRTAKRYNPLPYILILAALALHPLSGGASLAAFAAAVLATLLIVLP